MARFFKYVFRLLLIAYIAIILALMVPPLIGYTMATVQDSAEGNQPVGTVNYAKRISLGDLNAGDKILITETDSVNVYTVQYVDSENSTVTVAQTENATIPVRSYVYKLVLSVPYIGYVIIALQSTQGVIVLAMIAVLLILLCILTGIWSRKVKEEKQRRKAEKAEAKKRAAEQNARDERAAGNAGDNSATRNTRAEAYFAARRAEQNRAADVQTEEYEDFPPAAAPAPETSSAPKTQTVEYFDEDEENEGTDSWLHDDVDDEDLLAGLNNQAATESLMATARLFAINRAAKVKEQMASEHPGETVGQTRVVSQGELAAARSSGTLSPVENGENIQVEAKNDLKQKGSVQDGGNTSGSGVVKQIAVDKIINLKELKEQDEDTQQIVLTINIRVVEE